MSEPEQYTHGYLYILREREFVLLNQDVYKLGMTIQGRKLRINRLNAYKKDSELVLAVYCPMNRVADVERSLKRAFCQAFQRHGEVAAKLSI